MRWCQSPLKFLVLKSTQIPIRLFFTPSWTRWRGLPPCSRFGDQALLVLVRDMRRLNRNVMAKLCLTRHQSTNALLLLADRKNSEQKPYIIAN